MRKRILFPAGAMLAIVGGCSRTDNGDLVVKRPSHVDVQSTTDTLHLPSMTTKMDTINAPVVGTQKKVVKVPAVQRP